MCGRLCVLLGLLASASASAQTTEIPYTPAPGQEVPYTPPPAQEIPYTPPPGTPQPVPYGTNQVGVLLGTDTAWDGGPASFRLTLQSGHDIAGNEKFAVGGNMPVTLVTQGEDSFGVSTTHTALEFPPSLRFRIWPLSIVRLYLEVGIGFVWIVSNETDGWYVEEDSDFGFMTRSAVGLEFGKPHGFMFLLEPLSTRTYWLGDTYGRFGIMLGGGLRL